MNKPGIQVDTFTLATEGGAIHAEMRLVLADDGTEMLWHYENGHLRFAHPAKRCSDCNEVITGDGIGRRCYECADAAGLTF